MERSLSDVGPSTGMKRMMNALTGMRMLPVFAIGCALALIVSMNAKDSNSLVVGGGCFWCTDAAYKLLPGVTHVTCGYAGGDEPNPTYEQVCAHVTGHAEVIKIDYDPAKISLERLLEYFWQVHNPTQVGGQGNDHGPQYRSVILYANEAQRTAAEKSRADAAKRFRDPITTEIAPLKKFWPAEAYHQDYFANNPHQGYCAYIIAPKIKKLEHELGQSTK
jgi:peptide-methionine (S)-S-oxide reductase